jgi:hypothetical protein
MKNPGIEILYEIIPPPSEESDSESPKCAEVPKTREDERAELDVAVASLREAIIGGININYGKK